MNASRPSLGLSLLPILVLVLLLAADVLAFGEDSSYGSNQIALLLASGLTVAIGMGRGQNWASFEGKIKDKSKGHTSHQSARSKIKVRQPQSTFA